MMLAAVDVEVTAKHLEQTAGHGGGQRRRRWRLSTCNRRPVIAAPWPFPGRWKASAVRWVTSPTSTGCCARPCMV